MKYIVTVAGREIEVDLEGDQGVGGRSLSAALRRVPGTPLHYLLVAAALDPGDRGERTGQWTIGALRRALGTWRRWISGPATSGAHRCRHRRPARGAAEGADAGLVDPDLAEPGQGVTRGAGLVALEAMKMENELKAAADAKVKTVRVRAGEAVKKGQVLVEFE